MNTNSLRFILVAMTIVFAYFAHVDYTQNKLSESAIKQGLEQCRKLPIGYINTSTIWIKDCIEYTKAINESNKDNKWKQF